MNQKYRFYAIAVVLVIATFFFAQSGIAQKISLNPIKPAAQSQPLTDEQQGILAVRTIKPSVVDILGVSTSTVIQLNPTAPSLSSQPAGDKGTGFIISADGLVVTNEHVVDDTSFQYTVMFADGTKYPAQILGRDQYDDVALLKINTQNLPVASLGDSDALETGQTVFAIGNTLGRYQNTVTKGVVSGLGRSVQVPSDTGALQPREEQLIQTDAAISPGNSGGPLINLAGQVVGMNTLIDTEGESLAFAIPINVIKSVVQQLQTFGTASRPYLGVQFLTLSELAMLPGTGVPTEGAYISQVAPGSPAAAAGLKPGDVITAINGEKLNELNELDAVVSKYAAGQQILVSYSRNLTNYNVQLILANYK